MTEFFPSTFKVTYVHCVLHVLMEHSVSNDENYFCAKPQRSGSKKPQHTGQFFQYLLLPGHFYFLIETLIVVYSTSFVPLVAWDKRECNSVLSTVNSMIFATQAYGVLQLRPPS